MVPRAQAEAREKELQRQNQERFQVLESALRAERAHGHRIVILCDNLGLVLAITKGRGKTPEANQTCRELATLSLFTNVRIIVRWVASELNAADPPSRGSPWVGGLAPRGPAG